MSEVWIYEEGNIIQMFATADEARAWLAEHDPDGVAFKYDRSELRQAGSADQFDVSKTEE